MRCNSGECRTPTNIYDGAFSKNSWRLLTFNYCSKTLHYMFPRHIRMYFKWFFLNQSLNNVYVTQSFSKQKQLAGSFKSFRSKNSGKTSKKTSMTEENMVAIYNLGLSCKTSVQKDFKILTLHENDELSTCSLLSTKYLVITNPK